MRHLKTTKPAFRFVVCDSEYHAHQAESSAIGELVFASVDLKQQRSFQPWFPQECKLIRHGCLLETMNRVFRALFASGDDLIYN